MKFVTISDTHGQHSRLTLPTGDVLIHAGDISSTGKEGQVFDFIHWFAQQPFEHKIFIAGNHDFYFEKALRMDIEKIIPKQITYLSDSSVTINGIKIWGSPISPWFYDWAFNRYRGADIRRHWDLIEPDTDILVTHGPVYNILDSTTRGEHVGCEDLLHTVNTIKPRVHICGHIHEAYGRQEINDTTFINASVLDENYVLVNKAVEFEICSVKNK